MKQNGIVAVLIVVALVTPMFSVASVGVSNANEQPLADAGLDQTVTRGSTVHLDATGSRDPDGSVEAYRWNVTAPNDDPVSTSCADCARTTFRATQVGTYTVELTVTDDDTATATDVLFVTVDPGDGPEIRLDTPDSTDVGSSTALTASLERGAAPLSHVVWRIDDTVVANDSVSASATADEITTTFPEEGTREITATVYDEDGQRDVDANVIDAQSNESGSIGDDTSPVILGPQTVIGAQPLDGQYRIDHDVSHQLVRHVRWYSSYRQIGYGAPVDVDWTPGNHELHTIVTYVDGSQSAGRFEDETNDVVADPKPGLTLNSLDSTGELSGSVTATDGYDNLQSVVVSVDGSTIHEWVVAPDEYRNTDTGRQTIDFATTEVDSGRPQNVSIVATDTRGQTTTITRTVTPSGEPEIVRSEFVNDPVDSYHERIDADRYAAHHVLEIRLNGADPEAIEPAFGASGQEGVSSVETAEYHISEEYTPESDVLRIHSYWSGDSPGEYRIRAGVDHEVSGTDRSLSSLSVFEVTPSDPELRFDVATDGTDVEAKHWGILVDASESFDPDGTQLDYNWEQGAESVSGDGKVARFDSRNFATIIIEDGYERRTKSKADFHYYFNPGFENVSEITGGPYKPNDTVRYAVRTADYKFTKNRYTVNIGLAGEHVDVLEWQKYDVDKLTTQGVKMFAGTIEVRAADLSDGTELVLYNEARPERSRATTSLSSVELFADLGEHRTNVTVSDHRYIVEEPRMLYATAITEDARDSYIEDGYEVDRKSTYGTEYTLEEHVRTQEAKYETREATFTSRLQRQMFLDDNPSWTSAGSYTETVTWTTTETEWRSSRSGRGTYTGETRSVLVEPAEYRTKKEYRYSSRFGSGTYWAYGKRGADHEYTGRSKRVKVSDAEYRTEYRFEYEESHSRTTRYYEASNTVQVQEEKYEWQTKLTTKDDSYAKRLVDHDPDIRIESTSPAIEWEMIKRGEMTRKEVDSFDDPETVVGTNATISGDVVRRYVHPSSGNETGETVDTFTEEYTSEKIKTKEEIKEELYGSESSSDDCQSTSGHTGSCFVAEGGDVSA